MAFELQHRDLLARIGRIRTKSGTVETPLFLPVVNPGRPLIRSKDLHDVFGFEAIMTNAYIIRRHYGDKPIEEGLHRFLDFDKVIMTDSGAYQILIYGDVEVLPREIIEYQERIDTDIATILDHPTGWKVARDQAEETVDSTLERARELFRLKTPSKISWVGPIQGGEYLDLIMKSAREMGKLPFSIHALGSPTQVMQSYRFDILLDMILSAKMNLPIERPFHLFGAGHPLIFSLAVSMGCDLFDSAAYAIYAREARYMTTMGTHRLNQLDYFPCRCPRCVETTPSEIREMPSEQQETFLAEHNLYVSQAEIRNIKQHVKEGRLWELVQARAHGHPKLIEALRKLRKYEDYLEQHSPVTKKRGIFFLSSLGLARPEIVRHRRRMAARFSPPHGAELLLLIPQPRSKPFHRSGRSREISRMLAQQELSGRTHVCFITVPFGIVPIELDEIYPLSQHEAVMPPDLETEEYVAVEVKKYIARSPYELVVLVRSPTRASWETKVLYACKSACNKKGVEFRQVSIEDLKLNPTSLVAINDS